MNESSAVTGERQTERHGDREQERGRERQRERGSERKKKRGVWYSSELSYCNG